MKQLVQETTVLLQNHESLLRALSDALFKKGNLNATEIAKIAEAHNVEVSVREEGYMYIENYEGLMEQ